YKFSNAHHDDSRVQIALAASDVLRRKEPLTDREPMAPEGRFVLPHQRRLADRGGRLLLRDRAGALDQAEPRHPGRDRARGHEYDPAPLAHRRDVGGERLDARGAGPDAGRRHEAAADLHDEPPYASEPARGGHRALAPGPGDGGAACAPASAAESDARRAATARTRSVSPPPVTAEMTKSGRPFAAQCRSTRSRLGAASGKSALLATTICG